MAKKAQGVVSREAATRKSGACKDGVTRWQKDEILRSRNLLRRSEVYVAVLNDGAAYTLEEAEELAAAYLERKV